jgi:hypothetical protein
LLLVSRNPEEMYFSELPRISITENEKGHGADFIPGNENRIDSGWDWEDFLRESLLRLFNFPVDVINIRFREINLLKISHYGPSGVIKYSIIDTWASVEFKTTKLVFK